MNTEKNENMKWTTEKPTSAGWWWWEAKAGDRYGDVLYQEDTRQPVLIYECGTTDMLRVQMSLSYDTDPLLTEVSGRFAGPIEEPQDP
jgi:hypothetical protein